MGATFPSPPASNTSAVSDSLLWQCAILVALIVCTGLLTGAEAAYFSLGRARLRRTPRPGPAEPLVTRPHDLLVTLMVGITVVNIGAAALATHIADQLFGLRYGLVVEMLVMILLLTTFGEALPMTLAVRYPEQFLAVVRRPVRWLELAVAPVRVTLEGLTRLTVRLVGQGAEDRKSKSMN